MTGRVIVVGSLNIDTVLEAQRHPRVGETIHTISSCTMPGGKGGNQATAAAQAGARVILVGALGHDGERYRRHLNACGIDTHPIIQCDDTATGSAIVIIGETGENSILVSAGANDRVSDADLEGLVFQPGDVVSLQYEVPTRTVLACARQASSAGATVLINPSPWRDEQREALTLADLIVVNELESHELANTAMNPKVCITLGSKGARWGGLSAKAPRIKPVDTTGAGDAFTGTLAAGIAAGAGSERALQNAVAAATAACLPRGAQLWRSV